MKTGKEILDEYNSQNPEQAGSFYTLEEYIDAAIAEATNDRTAIDEELMAFKRALEIQGYYEVMNWLDEADRFEVVNVMNLMEEELNSRADL